MGQADELARQDSRHRLLGGSGIAVAALGVGAVNWAQGRNDETVFQAFQAFLDAGIDFFDTAEVYGRGKSERLLGECTQRDPRTVVIASKFAPFPTRFSHRQFMQALDASLSRLGGQTIDLYYVHWPYGFLSVERLMDMMAQAVKAGKVRAVGVSNFSARQMRRAVNRLGRYNIPLAANQVQYSLLHRRPEVNGVLSACHELNVALVAYQPLASGRLTSRGVLPAPSGSLAATRGDDNAASKRPEALLETLEAIAQARGKSVSQVALNWLLRIDERVIPIPGASSARHANENAGTLGWALSDDEFATIDRASSPWKR